MRQKHKTVSMKNTKVGAFLKDKEIRSKFQRFGNILSGMIMPLIGVIIAWGIITAFVIPTGWAPNDELTNFFVGPGINFLVPVLIGFMGGYNVYKLRGGFMGALVTLMLVAGVNAWAAGSIYGDIASFGQNADPIITSLGPQFLGAMLIGPLSALFLKKTEKLWQHKIKTGFEMLINNFYFAFVGCVLGIASFYVMVFPLWGINWLFGEIIDGLTQADALPVTSLFVEPAKPLFLNNAINHGVFSPLGLAEVVESGKSPLFYIESNPGPGMGLLLGILLFDKDPRNKSQAGGATVIHFFGGIHEVYFPFILVRPMLILSTLAGGVVGTSMLQIFGAGAVGPASPGSVVALYLVSANGGLEYAGLTLAIFGSLITSLIVTFFLLKLVYNKRVSKDIAVGVDLLNKLKGKKSKYAASPQRNMNTVSGAPARSQQGTSGTTTKTSATGSSLASAVKNAKHIVFACDAGMGSSALGASLLRKEIETRKISGVKVTNSSLTTIPASADIIVTQNTLLSRAKKQNPTTFIYPINQFLMKDEYKKLLDALKAR